MEDGPIDAFGQLEVWVEEQLIARRQWRCAGRLRNGMEGSRVDGAIAPIRGEEFREGAMKVIADEWGDDILVT